VSPRASRGEPEPQRRGLDLALPLLAFGLAFGLRYFALSARPMHADEANQALKFGELLEHGRYVFDPLDHHGPTLYYLALIPAWLRGEASLAALTETTLRLTPALAGSFAVVLLWLLTRPLGRWTACSAALLLAISPAAVYYSRYFVQETLLVTFTLAAWVSGLRFWRSSGTGRALAAGTCLGLMLATKSSALFFAPAIVVALALGAWPRLERRPEGRQLALAGLATLLVIVAFYSSFGSHLAGLRDALASPSAMFARATGGATGHEKPWWYFASLFVHQRVGGYVWDQTVFAIPALVGGLLALRQAGLPRSLAINTALVAVVLSVTPYKTPWIVVNLVPGLCALAAVALERARTPLRLALTCVVLLGLLWQTRQAVFLRPADPRNPFAYVHTVPDMLKVPALAASVPEGPVKVIAGEYWPLPWYLRARPLTGYWYEAPEDCDGALVFADLAQADTVRSRLHGKYQESLLGLRPGVLLVAFARQPD